MTTTGFLVATLVAAGVALAVAWWVAQRERDRTAPPSSHEPAPRPAEVGRAGRVGQVDVIAAYRAAIGRARRQSTERLLAAFYAGTREPGPTPEGLFDWLAAHHVLVSERGVILLAAGSSTTSAAGDGGHR